MRIFTEPVDVTSPVGATFNSVIMETWVCWAVVAISINSSRINNTSMISTTFLSIVIVTHMHVAVTVIRRTHVHLEVFSIWVKETDTVVTFRIIDTRATWVKVITGFTGINRRSYWNSNTSTFLVTHVNRAGTINVSSTLKQ
jgi:ethanolamine transporter EutH